MNKLLTALLWLLIVFGFLYLLQGVYEKEPSFYLYVTLTLSVSIGYDGLKSIMNYRPMYYSDSKKLLRGAVMSVLFVVFAFGSFLIGAIAHVSLHAPETLGQVLGFGGFSVFYILAMLQMSQIKRQMIISNVP
jgi:hypothetical protein